MLQQQKFELDSSALAIILYEKCSYDVMSEVRINGRMKQKVRRIIKVLKPGGVSYGDVTIMQRCSPESRVDIRGVKASTYSLENGKLVQHDLNSDNISKDRTDYLIQSKFSLPAVQAGTIIDVSYTIESPISLLFAIHDFQHEIPTLYSELDLYIYSPLTYLFFNLGSAKKFNEFDDSRKSLKEESIPDAYTMEDVQNDTRNQRWVRRNIPSVAVEPFAPSIAGLRERLQLRITGVVGYGSSVSILDTWEKMDKSLLESFSFYKELDRNHPLLVQKTKTLTANLTDPLDKAKAVFAFVRNTMHAEGSTDIYISTDMEKLFEKRNASPSEINLMLIAMLRYAALDANPVLVTDRDEAPAIKELPDVSQFSKTVCELNIGKEHYYLDASDKNNAFGALQKDEYNGYARAIGGSGGRDVTLEPKGLRERQLVTVTTENADPSNYVLSIVCQYGTLEAAKQRTAWREDPAAVRKHVLSLLSGLGSDSKLVNYSIKGLDNPDTSLVLKYSVHIPWPADGIVYFNPHFFSYFSKNPFTNPGRTHPITLPATLDFYYNVHLKLPEGYHLDDAPKPAVVTLNDADNYKYMFEYDDKTGSLKLNSRIHMENVWYPVEQYDLIKQFFDKIVESQQKTYVFRKS